MIVEDGTGLADSNSYTSVSDLKAYWDNMGYDYSTLSDDEISILLIRGTRIIDGEYGNKYPGVRNSVDQALGWPRASAEYLDGYSISSAVVPLEIIWATCETAYVLNKGSDLQPVNDKNNIAQYSVAVEGAVTESTTYKDGGGFKRPEVTAIKDALARLIRLNTYGYAGILRM